MRLSRAPAASLPGRRRADRPYTPVYEPGPVRRFAGFLCEVAGWLFWWV
jgi:hypothetical protein